MWYIIKRFSRGILAGHALWASYNQGGKRVYAVTANHKTGLACTPRCNPNSCPTNQAAAIAIAKEDAAL